MSQLTHSLDSSLLVRDVAGDYRPANADEVLQAIQQAMLGWRMAEDRSGSLCRAACANLWRSGQCGDTDPAHILKVFIASGRGFKRAVLPRASAIAAQRNEKAAPD